MLSNLFQKKNQKPEPKSAELEMISIHIPKTAGTSFRNMLKFVYGDEHVIRVDINNKMGLKVENEYYTERTPPAASKILHGHFSYPRLKEKFDLPEGLPIITWLRDPVERVISNFYYLESRLIELLNEEVTGTNIRPKMQKSLLEFADAEENQNVMSRFCEGMDLKDMRFVGLNEHFSEDVKHLSSLLGWPEYKEFYHNSTPKKPNKVTAEERKAIAVLNQGDVELYNYGLELRKARMLG